MLKRSAKEALVLALVAVVLALAVYALRPDKIDSTGEAVDAGPAQTPPAMDGVVEIGLVDARRHFEDGTAMFADARHPADYAAGHIRGAVNAYPAETDPWLGELLTAVDPATLIITYCDGENCPLAVQLAELLILNGFTDVRYLTNGWSRWRENGHPVDFPTR